MTVRALWVRWLVGLDSQHVGKDSALFLRLGSTSDCGIWFGTPDQRVRLNLRTIQALLGHAELAETAVHLNLRANALSL